MESIESEKFRLLIGLEVKEEDYGFVKQTIKPITPDRIDFELLAPEIQSRRLVSLLIPSRARFERLKKTLLQYHQFSQNPEQIEYILGLDSDDYETIARLNELKLLGLNLTIVIAKRKEYDHLYLYLNQLAQLAKGKLLFISADDLDIQTHNWDQCLKPFGNQICILKPQIPEHKQVNVAPIISRKLMLMMGQLSYHSASDLWLDELSRQLGLEFQVSDVMLNHDRSLGAQFNMQQIKSLMDRDMYQKRLDIIQQITQQLLSSGRELLFDNQVELLKRFYGLEDSPDTISRYCCALAKSMIGDPKKLNFEVDPTIYSELNPRKILLNEMLLLSEAWRDAFLEKRPIDLKTLHHIQSHLERLVVHYCDHFLAWYYLFLVHLAAKQFKEMLFCIRKLKRFTTSKHLWFPGDLLDVISPLGSPFLIYQWDKLKLQASLERELRYHNYVYLIMWQVYVAEGLYEQRQGNLQEAETAFEQARVLWPSFMPASYFLAYNLSCQQKNDKAHEIWLPFKDECLLLSPFFSQDFKFFN